MKPVSELLRRRDGVADGLPNTTLWHVRPDDTVFAALETLARHEVGALVVMDGAQMVGILSERDYTRKVALQGRNSRETRVAEIMTRGVVTVLSLIHI
jgi:CBS domain-containing protein